MTATIKTPPKTDTDVLIMGGGLAGFTLALQLIQQQPELRVTVLERYAMPFTEAAHKIGESSVEVGACYLNKVLGLSEHLMAEQLPKFGLRLFFGGREGTTSELEQWAELGPSTEFEYPSYQLDRGKLENHLAEQCKARGVVVRDNSKVSGIEAGNGKSKPHEVTINRAETISCRWMVDASGRQALLKRKLELKQDNSHNANSLWFRLDASIKIDDWSDDQDWQQRLSESRSKGRWLSTNHFMTDGSWTWLIPLSGGRTSIGVVYDPKMHDDDKLKTFEDTVAWLHTHHPRLAEVVETHSDTLMDFKRLKNYSHGCTELFSKNRWAITGEAGVFLDPFYSPGTDFIAIGNSYIADLIYRDMSGQHLLSRPAVYSQLYLGFYEATLEVYQDQYPLFGQPLIMSIKIAWDYANYWGITTFLFTQNRMTDVSFMRKCLDDLTEIRAVNRQIQALFRELSRLEEGKDRAGKQATFIDQHNFQWLDELNRKLSEPLGDEAMREQLLENIAGLEAFASEITAYVLRLYPEANVGELAALPPSDSMHLQDIGAALELLENAA